MSSRSSFLATELTNMTNQHPITPPQPVPQDAHVCTGCGMSRHETIKVIAEESAIACCPDCSTLTVEDRNAIREGCGTPRPVPVAERPWARDEWCDTDGRCWWFDFNDSWEFRKYLWMHETATHSLPAYAIPLPQVGEVNV